MTSYYVSSGEDSSHRWGRRSRATSQSVGIHEAAGIKTGVVAKLEMETEEVMGKRRAQDFMDADLGTAKADLRNYHKSDLI